MPNAVIKIFDRIYNWARANSLCPIVFANSCCEAEIMSAVYAGCNLSDFISENFAASPRQADLLIVAGTITHKSAPSVLKIYEQMAEPKYVMAIGACACTGGMFKDSSYSVVYGIDKVLPVDVYLPMCPPKPEALSEALIKLQQKIKTETIAERKQYLETHKPKLIYKNHSDVLTEEKTLN